MTHKSLANQPLQVDRDRVQQQIELWQKRVLDLRKSNPLVGLNHSRVAKLRVMSPDASSLFSTVVVHEKKVRMPLVQSERHEEPYVQPGDLEFDASSPTELMRRLRRIHHNARTTLEERGVQTLYLAFGSLSWQDTQMGDLLSPICMVPCIFESKGPATPLRLAISNDEIEVNPALKYLLETKHKLRLPDFPDEPGEQTLSKMFHGVRKAIRELKWQVREEVWLGTFSFESLVIYRDLASLVKCACDHPVVASLARAIPLAGKSETLPDDLDSLQTPDQVPHPVLPVDSSQLEALTVAAAGRHLVIHGPPGTGKSQTITNLIADALARGKKVLFVSAKMAALEVVHNRLKELGLDLHCLEAHSTTSGKHTVIEELRQTLEAQPPKSSGQIQGQIKQLLEVRDALNNYVKALHSRIEPLGLTVFRAIGRVAALRSAPDIKGKLPWSDPLKVSQDDLNPCLNALEELASNSDVFAHRDVHPWRGFLPMNLNLTDEESLEECLNLVRDASLRLTAHASRLASVIPEGEVLSLKGWQSLRIVLAALAREQTLPNNWWTQTTLELSRLSELFRDASTKQEELESILSAIRQLTTLEAAELASLLAPLESQFRSWTAIARPAYWRWRRRVKKAFRPDCLFSHRRCRVLLAQANRAAEIERWFRTYDEELRNHVSAPLNVPPHALFQVSKSFEIAALCRGAFDSARIACPSITTIDDALRQAIHTHLSLVPPDDSATALAFHRLDHDWCDSFVGELSASTAPLPEVLHRVEALLQSWELRHDWIRLSRALHHCETRGLSAFVQSLGKMNAAEAPKCFEKRFYRLWVSRAIETNPVLRQYTPTKQQDLINKFRGLDLTVQQLAKLRARAGAWVDLRHVQEAADFGLSSSEVQILKHELQKKKRFKPLRRLFAEIPNVLLAVKPCLLMSPLSVSTYLKYGSYKFDLVVFDEASQLPTAEAVPSILRAEQVIVAGDPKQLPPTSFFQAAVLPEDDEDEQAPDAFEPLESLLDDCVSIVPVFQETYLRWHYRSRDERLIRFSNHYFYNNRLVTFPAADDRVAGQGLRFVYVPDGIYDRGKSRTNRREAEVVARLAIEHFEKWPERSLGIVAFNVSQCEAIEEEIERVLQERPDLENLFSSEGAEPVFVKSLENVQGDERDTMVISVGYGRDAHGALSMNFGPINAESGWRRLNVLVTRAKWECILVSSLRGHDLAGVNPNNRGAVALRNFLEYTERAGELPVEPPRITDPPPETNDFEDAVQAALMDKGYAVDAQVGSGPYRIDLAIRDRYNPNRYVIGIECDGATYHSSRTARDRDLLRQQVLERMGWRIYRVWSTEWFQNPESVMTSLTQAIEQAQKSAGTDPPLPPEPPPPPEDTEEQQPPTVPSKYKPGVKYKLYQPSGKLRREDLLSPKNHWNLAHVIEELVYVEGPIYVELLQERLKQIYGVNKVGARIRRNIDHAVMVATLLKTVCQRPGTEILEHPGQQLTTFRRPVDGLRRSIDLIPPDEIELAVLHVAEDQFGISEEDISGAVAQLFGFTKPSAYCKDQIKKVVRNLVRSKKLSKNGLKLNLA